MRLEAEEVIRITVTLAPPLRVGPTGKGELSIIPITGGTFEGPGLCGRVMPGGADWNTVVNGRLNHVFAKYWLQTEDGEVISVENEGYIDNACSGTVIKTTPRFLCSLKGKYARLAGGTYVGELFGGSETSINIRVYRVK